MVSVCFSWLEKYYGMSSCSLLIGLDTCNGLAILIFRWELHTQFSGNSPSHLADLPECGAMTSPVAEEPVADPRDRTFNTLSAAKKAADEIVCVANVGPFPSGLVATFIRIIVRLHCDFLFELQLVHDRQGKSLLR
jgi:hypothetical protein